VRVYNSTGVLKKVLLCSPTYYELVPVNEVALKHIDAGDKVDHEVVGKEHAEMADALRSASVEVLWENPHPEHPAQVFTRDFGTNTKMGPLIGKFRYPQRFGDEDFAIAVFEREDIPMVGRVTAGAFEGGDCYYLDDETLVVGIGNRSTPTGVEKARGILAPHGINVLGVEFLAKWNHLDCIFGVLAERLCLAVPEVLPDSFKQMLRDRKFEIIEMTGDDSMKMYPNVVTLGNGRVLSFKQNVELNKKLRSLGIEVLDPSMSQSVKNGGGPHCLTFEVEREPK